MTIFTTPPPTARSCTWRLLWGGKAIEITTERKRGKRLVPLAVLYLVERKAPDLIELVKDGSGEIYTVSLFNCTCLDAQFAGSRGIVCKHRCACLASGLLGEVEK